MIVPKDQVIELWDRKLIQHINLKVDLTPDEVKIFDERYLKTFDEDYLNKIRNNPNINEIKFLFDIEFKMILLKEFPSYYYPSYSDRVGMLKMEIKQFEMANSLSKGRKISFKERYFKSLDSFKAKNSSKAVIRFNQRLTSKDIEFLKNKFSDDYIIKYTTSEKGILLVYDSEGYKNNPKQIRLQFQLRKVFQDIKYKRVIPVGVDKAFSVYFREKGNSGPKLVVLCGKTKDNEFLYKKLKVFDPFCKIMWLTVNDLDKNSDEIFDMVLPKLGSDYSYESLIYDMKDVTKEILPQEMIKELRDKINAFSRSFSLEGYVETEFAILEAGKKYIVTNQFNHLRNVLDSLKISKDSIFQKFFQESYEI